MFIVGWDSSFFFFSDDPKFGAQVTTRDTYFVVVSTYLITHILLALSRRRRRWQCTRLARDRSDPFAVATRSLILMTIFITSLLRLKQTPIVREMFARHAPVLHIWAQTLRPTTTPTTTSAHRIMRSRLRHATETNTHRWMRPKIPSDMHLLPLAARDTQTYYMNTRTHATIWQEFQTFGACEHVHTPIWTHIDCWTYLCTYVGYCQYLGNFEIGQIFVMIRSDIYNQSLVISWYICSHLCIICKNLRHLFESGIILSEYHSMKIS